MRMRDDQVRGLPAFTESGERVGTVQGLVLDVGSQEVVQYAITRTRTLRAPFSRELLVSRTQVVSIDETKMVIENGGVEVAELLAETAKESAPATSSVSRRDN
jgi:sporulation protein YlmC with PRC-barrel domain